MSRWPVASLQTMKAGWTVAAVLSFVWWAAVHGPLAPVWKETPSAVGNYSPLLCDDNDNSLNVAEATEESYSKFLEKMRSDLSDVHEPTRRVANLGLRVLRPRPSVLTLAQYYLVELLDFDRNSITIAINITNLYVEAYRVGDQSYFFSDTMATAGSLVFAETTRHPLPYGSDYTALQSVGGGDLQGIPLGISALRNAITTLQYLPETGARVERSRARSLLVIIQMISEAARFRYIEQRVVSSFINGDFRPDAHMMSLLNHWMDLSWAIQRSNNGNNFYRPVQLQNATNALQIVDNVGQINLDLALMCFVCVNGGAASSRPAVDQLAADDDDTCPASGGKVRITGRNGLCVDVKGGDYEHDGNPILLCPCKTNDDPNQLWTFESDGTIRSGGKCLTTYGYQTGVYVMIYNCNNAVKEATHWEVWEYGTILNPVSGLVLSATSGIEGTTLTVESNDYAVSQTWRATNITEPPVYSIVGFQHLCLHRSGSAVWVQRCNAMKAEQRWAVYRDGSIRPNQDRDSCLTTSTLEKEGIVSLTSCSQASSAQRWVFTTGGTIVNLISGLVMDVKYSDPCAKQIIIYPPTAKPNQHWILMA